MDVILDIPLKHVISMAFGFGYFPTFLIEFNFIRILRLFALNDFAKEKPQERIK